MSVPQSLVLQMPRFGLDVVLAHPPEFRLMPEIMEQAQEQARGEDCGRLQAADRHLIDGVGTGVTPAASAAPTPGRRHGRGDPFQEEGEMVGVGYKPVEEQTFRVEVLRIALQTRQQLGPRLQRHPQSPGSADDIQVEHETDVSEVRLMIGGVAIGA